ncbi:MAG: 50S ribosomal protein L6 [Bacteroidetes bacterium]|mgnify:CR=1 FL=1|jgi:large subunit ribosomal protein L6|nr:50S ribosomal protein L6 [Bacteroidota bacterium]
MSRIGKQPIQMDAKASFSVDAKNEVTVKGPKGELTLQVHPDIKVAVEDGSIVVSRPTDQKTHRSLHGLYRSLIANMVTGVTDGYKKELEIIGVGFRASVANGVLELGLGYSHPIFFLPPDGISVDVDTKRGKNPIIIIEGIDNQMVGQVAAKIRGLRPPEPYKGKGVRYVGEYVRRKAGKSAAR